MKDEKKFSVRIKASEPIPIQRTNTKPIISNFYSHNDIIYLMYFYFQGLYIMVWYLIVISKITSYCLSYLFLSFLFHCFSTAISLKFLLFSSGYM